MNARSAKLKNYILIVAGAVAMAIGVVGIFLPVLPTTVFFLMTAACWMKGSPRMHAWLMNSKFPGRYLRNYIDNRGITRSDRIFTLVILWLGIGSTVVFAVSATWLRLLLTAIAVGVTIHVSTLKRIDPRNISHGAPRDKTGTGRIRAEHDTKESPGSPKMVDS